MHTNRRGTALPFRAVPNPFAAASALAAPSRPDRIEDPLVNGLQWARTVLGLAATVWLLTAYPLAEG